MQDALHAEWTKARTLPGTAWLLLVAVALTVIVGAAVAANAELLTPGRILGDLLNRASWRRLLADHPASQMRSFEPSMGLASAATSRWPR
jgi:hypothetical protein